MKKRVCFITGSRAEYGLQYQIIRKVKSSKFLELKLIVTGMHLESQFGNTYKEIEADGFKIDGKIKIVSQNDTIKGVVSSFSNAVAKISSSIKKIRPDIIVLLGDRYEIFAASCAAMFNNVPIAHIHGGEVTEGMIDEAIRHSITKMAHIHFTSTEEYRRRVIQMGEDKSKVFNFGAPGIENIQSLKKISRPNLEKKLRIKFNRKNILITYHPLTLKPDNTLKEFNELLEALKREKNTNLFFTKSNSDFRGTQINKLIDKFVKYSDNYYSFKSLGRFNYLSLLSHVDIIVGNSSSGIIEAPSLKISSINIGDRQKGRVRSKSTIDCRAEKFSIIKAIKKSQNANFKKVAHKVRNPYQKNKTSLNIVRKLEKINTDKLLHKRFYSQ